MKLFSFFSKKVKTVSFPDQVPDNVDTSGWTGADFYLIIAGATQIDKNNYDKLLTPKTLEWSRMNQIKWPIYKVGEGEYSFSFEKHGMEITFSETIQFNTAKQIANEIIEKLSSSNQILNLYILAKPRVFKNKL